jgi:hypothetical protein
MKRIMWAVGLTIAAAILIRVYMASEPPSSGERIAISSRKYKPWQPNPGSQGAGFCKDY